MIAADKILTDFGLQVQNVCSDFITAEEGQTLRSLRQNTFTDRPRNTNTLFYQKLLHQNTFLATSNTPISELCKARHGLNTS